MLQAGAVGTPGCELPRSAIAPPILPPVTPTHTQAGMHAPGKNPSNAEAAPGGPAAIFTAALDKRLRSLEEAAGGGLAVAADVDAGAVVTQIVAPGPGAREGWG